MILRLKRTFSWPALLVGGVAAASLAAACGPMPGYRPPAPPENEASQGTEPGGPPAPMPPSEDEPYDGQPDEDAMPDEDAGWETPPEARPPAPVYRPPEPVPDRLEPTPSTRTAPTPTPAPEPIPAAPGVRVIELDKDSAYIIDAARNLCFFRYQASVTPIDCARLGESASPSPQPAPQPAPAPAPQPAPDRAPQPQPAAPQPPQRSGAFTTDDLARFQVAFNAIFCDRVAQRPTPAEQRIREAGLDEGRYEAIEAWMAEDDKRWWEVTDKARVSCPR